MPIPIIYVKTTKPQGLNRNLGPMFVLAYDKWNDYHYQTMFSAYRIDDQAERYIGQVRILFEGQTTDVATSNLLENAPSADQGGFMFSINKLFISLGENINYYTNLVGAFPKEDERNSILAAINDTIYLESKDPKNESLKLREEPGFQTSLLRGPDEVRAYGEARHTLYPNEYRTDRFNFTTKYTPPDFQSSQEIAFRFDSDPTRPTNTTVLIGPNGTGKSQILKSIASNLSSELTNNSSLSNPKSKFDNIIYFDHPYYYYHLYPQANHRHHIPFYSTPRDILLEILSEDVDYNLESRPKFTNLMRTLKDGLDFDSILIEVNPNYLPKQIHEFTFKDSGQTFLDITKSALKNRTELVEYLSRSSVEYNLCFSNRNKARVERFSSGQITFVLLAMDVISQIKQNSLLLLDEPELFLHPNLETAFMRMLRTLLQLFESYAIIATHSIFMVREVPAKCVRVFAPSEITGVSISVPSIETFGADIADIANLVFDNIAATKPHEEWLKGLIKTGESYNDLRNRIGDKLTNENLTFIRNFIATRDEQNEK